jgi:hypothetical protein
MKRRNFLFSSAALAVPFADAAEFGPGEIKLGVATYSFRSFQRDLCIKYVKQLGIEYVDVKEFHLPQTDSPAAIAAGRKAFDKAGLKVIGGGNVGLPEPDEAGLRKHFEYAKAAGFPMIICAPTNDNLGAVEKLARYQDCDPQPWSRRQAFSVSEERSGRGEGHGSAYGSVHGHRSHSADGRGCGAVHLGCGTAAF